MQELKAGKKASLVQELELGEKASLGICVYSCFEEQGVSVKGTSDEEDKV